MLQDRTDNEMCSREEELSFGDLYDVSFLLEDDVLVDLCALPDEPEEELNKGSSSKLMELSEGDKRKSSAESVMQAVRQGVKLVRESNISEAARSLNQAIQKLDREVSQYDTEPDEESSPIDDVVNLPASLAETAIDISVLDCSINAKYRAVLRMLSNSVLPEEHCLTELLQESILRNRLLPNVAPVGRQRRLCTKTGTCLGYTGRIVVVGDLHGQYRDLRALFLDPSVGGMPSPENAYVFNGDLVDRGDMSVEILIALLVAQSINPQNIVVLRGNHETERMYRKHGFSTEVLRKYSATTLALFQRLFQCLPFAAVIEDSVFVCHGGLGPLSHTMTIAEINGLDRFCEPRSKSAMFEIMWCDPSEAPGVKPGRVCAFKFGQDITEAFLARNGLTWMIRSHEWCELGFQWCHDNQCCTLFSAPNYCNRRWNLGAVVVFEAPDSMMPQPRNFAGAHYPSPAPKL